MSMRFLVKCTNTFFLLSNYHHVSAHLAFSWAILAMSNDFAFREVEKPLNGLQEIPRTKLVIYLLFLIYGIEIEGEQDGPTII